MCTYVYPFIRTEFNKLEVVQSAAKSLREAKRAQAKAQEEAAQAKRLVEAGECDIFWKGHIEETLWNTICNTSENHTKPWIDWSDLFPGWDMDRQK